MPAGDATQVKAVETLNVFRVSLLSQVDIYNLAAEAL
jgi:hypothetical protein